MSASVLIRRPPSAVFDYVSDLRHDVAWRTGVVEAAFTSSEPHGVGSEGFDRMEARGREMTSHWVVREIEPGSHVRWDLVAGPIIGAGGYVCEPVGADTRFTLEANVQPAGWYRLLGPIFGAIGRRQNQADVEKLRQIMEASDA